MAFTRTQMWPCAFAALVLLARAPRASARAGEATDGGPDDFLKVDTFEWLASSEASAAHGSLPELQTVLLTTHLLLDEGPEEDAQALVTQKKAPHPPPRRMEAEDNGKLLKAIWDRPSYRNERFDLVPTSGEHPCFAGFNHMINNTDRCNGWVRQYPPVGDSKIFLNTGVRRWSKFTLKAVVAGNINVWLEEGSTAQHEDISIKAAKIYTNEYDIDELRPAEGSDSWMEHECKVMGSMPFMYTCSNRINILVQECRVENAWVMSSDYLRNYPLPANAESGSNFDIVFYMCQELLDRNPNPYAAANTFAHELAHVVQGGFGFSFTAMTEGGATWLEGNLLHLAPRPMVYAWGFRDWNRINAAHIYANTKELNARKFYQIHAMFLTYLSQPELLGDHAASALQNYQTFDRSHGVWGRAAYDYFLQHVGQGRPAEFAPVEIDVKDPHNAFATALLNYRVALASQCIVDAALRPTEAQYLMPEHLRERPYWDCTSYRTYWSASSAAVDSASAELHYGGAAAFRLAAPRDATVSVAGGADPKVRTKVLAAGLPGGAPAEVRELLPGESATFEGSREIFVVQVNVDPEGETITPGEHPKIWRRSSYRCEGEDLCHGKAWWAGSGEGQEYAPNQQSALQTPVLQLPADKGELRLSFAARWDMEGEYVDGTTVGAGCAAKGFDGVQVRAVVYGGGNGTTEGEEGTVVVLRPEEGYGDAAGGESALLAFRSLYPNEAPCANFEGWTAQSDGWREQRFSLDRFAGKSVRLEVLFASDGSAGGEGFWLSGLEVSAAGAAGDAAAAATLFSGDGEEASEAMAEQVYAEAPAAGERGEHDGVPVIGALPQGYKFDSGLHKVHLTRSAPWSASWFAAEAGASDAARRAYLGWSYAAPTTNTKTARLHPGQEACMRLEAPFRGSVSVATLFTLVDKIGVSSVSLAFRAVAEPHAPVPGGKPLLSASYGVEDPGTHRFKLGGRGPVFEAGDAFLMCAGIGGVKRLPADDPNSLPFLHLPLTNVSTAGHRNATGATLLIVPAGAGQAAAFQTTGLDPWQGHTFVLRAEFAEEAPGEAAPDAAAMETPAPAGGRAFLAPPSR